MARSLTRVLARSSLFAGVAGFSFAEGVFSFRKSGLLVNVRTGRNRCWNKGGWVQRAHVCMRAWIRQQEMVQLRHCLLAWRGSPQALHHLCCTFSAFLNPPRYSVFIQTARLFIPAVNVLGTAVNMVLSQMLSSRVISCSHALIVMISSVFEAHFCVLYFTNCSHCCATGYEQPNQTWPRVLHSSIGHKPAPGERRSSEPSIKLRRKLGVGCFISLLVVYRIANLKV